MQPAHYWRSAVSVGEVLVWRDVLYDGPRNPGWPSRETLDARAESLAEMTAGGLSPAFVRRTLDQQYARLMSAGRARGIVLWFVAWEGRPCQCFAA